MNGGEGVSSLSEDGSWWEREGFPTAIDVGVHETKEGFVVFPLPPCLVAGL